MRDISLLMITDVMTELPRCIEPHQSTELAQKWMDELKVRHLPVRESGKVVGILSDRDLDFLARSDKSYSSPHGRKVEDAMISSVLTVHGNQTVKDVATQMIAHRVGSVVVTDAAGGVLGIFTDTDALKILSGEI